jgi:hypothetical protein
LHSEAYSWVRKFATGGPVTVLDIGGRNINGSVRDLFPGATTYRTLDILPGDGVDIVADAATWTPDRTYDVVVCTEVFEHTESWPQICGTAYAALVPGGTLILTMAGPGRLPHSAIDGGPVLSDGEHYGNVEPKDLSRVLAESGFIEATTDYLWPPGDTRAIAYKPEE